jgi:hypothetical protein
VTLGVSKSAGIVVLTEELVRLAAGGQNDAVALLRNELIAGIAQFLDTQFVDPAVAAVANISPASVTNGTTAIASAGSSAANANTDLQALISQFVAANPDVENMILLMKPANAIAISRAANAPTLGLKGGSIYGIPTVTSASVGDRLIALDASGVLFAEEDRIEIDASRNAVLQMDSSPADPTVASSVMTSLFAQNLAALKATNWITWKRAALSACKYVSGAAYA